MQKMEQCKMGSPVLKKKTTVRRNPKSKPKLTKWFANSNNQDLNI